MDELIIVDLRLQGGSAHRIETPLDILASDLINELIIALRLPLKDAKGNRISWQLDNLSKGTTFDGSKTLEENSTSKGDMILLMRQDGEPVHSESTPLSSVFSQTERISFMFTQQVADEIESRLLAKLLDSPRGQAQHGSSDSRFVVSPIFGTPSQDKQFQCDVFMVMPFSQDFQSIYVDYIKPVVESFQFSIRRADDFFLIGISSMRYGVQWYAASSSSPIAQEETPTSSMNSGWLTSLGSRQS